MAETILESIFDIDEKIEIFLMVVGLIFLFFPLLFIKLIKFLRD